MQIKKLGAARLTMKKSIFQAVYDQSLLTTLPIPCGLRKWLLLSSTVFQG